MYNDEIKKMQNEFDDDFNELLEDNIIVLNDENGNEVRFEFLDLIDYEGSEYIILLPEDEDEGEVVILKIDDSDSNNEYENYIGVEDEETLQAVFDIFKEKFKSEFNFTD